MIARGAATQARISFWQSATDQPGRIAIRQSTSHQAGTLEAQSPPLMMPGLKLIGWSAP